MRISEAGAKVTLKDFDVLKPIGSGSFGKVMKVRYRGDKQFYAMKALRKDLLLKANMVKCAQEEKNILQRINHPFIVKLHFAFQTRERLFMVLDLLPGGELFEHLKKEGRFTLERARLYAAEIASALHYLHCQGIIHRDLKLENVVLDHMGHACLTDLGLAKVRTDNDLSNSFCGTAEYVAPELLQGGRHCLGGDWWAFGVLLYEMLVGVPPFYSTDVREMYDFILNKPLIFPPGMDHDAQDLLCNLLERESEKRMTNGEAILAHPFFQSLDFSQVLQRKLVPQWIPDASDEPNGYNEILPLFPRRGLCDELDTPDIEDESGANKCGITAAKPLEDFHTQYSIAAM